MAHSLSCARESSVHLVRPYEYSCQQFPQFLSPDLPIPANWRRQRIELRPGYFEITGHQPIHHPQQLNAVYIQVSRSSGVSI